MADRIAVGVICKSHGVRGEASVEPWTDSPARFEELSEVTLVSPDESEERATRVEGTRLHAGRALVKFAGIETPEDVQLVQNWTIEIPETEARSLEEGEYFLHDLAGLTLIDATGAERGVITGVVEGGGGVLFEVKRADGKTFELPFTVEFCTEIDLERRRMVVNLPEGLDDLDAVAD